MSDWTVDTLREHTDALMSLDREHAKELRAADLRAVEVARVADREKVELALQNVERQRVEDKRSDENWRASANEFREQLKDQANSFLTKDQFDQYLRNQEATKTNAGTSLRGVIGIGLTVASLFITVVVIGTNFLFSMVGG